MPIELILGLFTLCGVLISSIITLVSNRSNISSTQTVETMKVQKELKEGIQWQKLKKD